MQLSIVKTYCYVKYILVLLFLTLVLINQSICQTTQIILTPSSTSPWTVPANVTKITVEAWGGGGGGATTNKSAGGGGGGYAASIVNINSGTNTIPFEVGLGGAPGNNGGNSNFDATLVGAGGFSGVNGSSSGSGGSANNGSIMHNGGSGGIGIGNDGGGGGSSAGPGGHGGNATYRNGGSPPLGGGAGGAGGVANNQAGSNGTIPGGGGGGQAGPGAANPSGSGANGQIRITYSTFSITSTTVNVSPICSLSTASITIGSIPTSLPNGNYTVTYTLTGSNAGTYPVDITVSSNSTTFNTVPLTGSTTLTITNIQNASYGNNLTANNTANITVIASVGGTISGGNSPICSGSSTGTMTVSGYSGTILAWELSQNGGSWGGMGGYNSSTFSQNTWNSGTWDYRVSVQNGSCPVAYSSIRTISIDALTVGGNLGKSHFDPICIGANTPTLTLAGSTGSIIRWEKRLNSGSWTNISHTATTYSETPPETGTWEYRVLVKSGVCNEAYSSTISVAVNATPSVVPVNNLEVCQNITSTTLSYSSPLGNPNNYNIIFDAPAIAAGFSNQNGSLNNPITVQVPYSVATGVYNATLRVGTNYPVCTSPDYPITLTVVDEITGTPGSITGLASVIQGQTGVAYSIPAIQYATAYIWNYTGSGATINGTGNSITIDFSESATSGNLTVYASNACGNSSTSAPLSISVSSGCTPPATPSATSNSPVCAGATLSFSTPTVSGATYSWTGPNSFSSFLREPSISNVTTSASGTYAVIITVGGCSSDAGTTSVTIDATPTTAAITTTPLNYCGTLTSGSLGANAPTVGTGAWSIVSGGTGTFSNSSSPNATFTANAYGTYVLRWTISNGTCTPSSANMTVNYYATPTTAAITTTPLNYCGTLTSGSLGANAPTVGTGAWSIVSGGTGTFSNSSSPNATFTANAYGTYVLRWTISNGTCTPSTANMTVNYYRIQAAVTLLSDNYECPELDPWQGFVSESSGYNAGATKVIFEVENLYFTSNWSFSYTVTGASVTVESVSPTPTSGSLGSGTFSNIATGSISLEFLIRNIENTELNVSLNVTSISDLNCTDNTARSDVSVILPMPFVGPFE
jgi:hypothetical protein